MTTIDNLGKSSFKKLAKLFSGLESADENKSVGVYEAEFIGPWWYRNTAGVSVGLVGLPRWKGKRICGKGNAINLLAKKASVEEFVPMRVAAQISRLDRRASLVLTYPDDSPFLLRYFIDELRQLDENTILAMTIVDLPLLKYLPFPFLLHRVDG